MTPDFKLDHFLSLLEAQNENAELLHGLCSENLDVSRRGIQSYHTIIYKYSYLLTR